MFRHRKFHYYSRLVGVVFQRRKKKLCEIDFYKWPGSSNEIFYLVSPAEIYNIISDFCIFNDRLMNDWNLEQPETDDY